jgi:DNA modification methylase
VYPTNVVHMATECGNRNHSAAFPVDLPQWFIKLFTREGDVVLDPFVGSGTTAVAAKELNRQFLGIDINPEYFTLAEESLLVIRPRLRMERPEIRICELVI